MNAWALFSIPMVVVLAAPPSDEPLAVVGVDASAAPSVVVEIVAPVNRSTVDITADMVRIDGRPVDDVAPVDPADVVVGLVIDDGPGSTDELLTVAQGGAVELVRNLGAGVRVAVATPSGTRSTPTADRRANLARIAGITAGAPAEAALSQVIIDSIAELGPAADIHIVVMLATPLDQTGVELDSLADAVEESGTTLYVATAGGVETPELTAIAQRSGGTSGGGEGLLQTIDQATMAISNRYLVEATIEEPGTHEIAVAVDGESFTATFDVPPAPATTPPGTPAPSQPGTAPADSPATAATAPGTEGPSGSVSNPTTGDRTAEAVAADQADDGSNPWRLIGGVLVLILMAAGLVAAWILLRRGVHPPGPAKVAPPPRADSSEPGGEPSVRPAGAATRPAWSWPRKKSPTTQQAATVEAPPPLANRPEPSTLPAPRPIAEPETPPTPPTPPPTTEPETPPTPPTPPPIAEPETPPTPPTPPPITEPETPPTPPTPPPITEPETPPPPTPTAEPPRAPTPTAEPPTPPTPAPITEPETPPAPTHIAEPQTPPTPPPITEPETPPTPPTPPPTTEPETPPTPPTPPLDVSVRATTDTPPAPDTGAPVRSGRRDPRTSPAAPYRRRQARSTPIDDEPLDATSAVDPAPSPDAAPAPTARRAARRGSDGDPQPYRRGAGPPGGRPARRGSPPPDAAGTPGVGHTSGADNEGDDTAP